MEMAAHGTINFRSNRTQVRQPIAVVAVSKCWPFCFEIGLDWFFLFVNKMMMKKQKKMLHSPTVLGFHPSYKRRGNDGVERRRCGIFS